MSPWESKRHKPYTDLGISRLKCIRCGGKAKYQWQICSDGNNFRPFCANCDVALNKLVLKWARHPEADLVGRKYSSNKGTP